MQPPARRPDSLDSVIRSSRPEHGQPGRAPAARAPRLLDRVRAVLRTRHYSARTEDAYVYWIRRFVLFHGKRHPAELSEPDVERFLSTLATERRVSASTQNQALAALLFLYEAVLERKLAWLANVVRAKRPERLPVVLTRDEVASVLEAMEGVEKLCAALLYGSGLRVLEVLRLRIKEVDFSGQQLQVRDGKGRKDRVTLLPASLQPTLRCHIDRVRAQHELDLRRGWGFVELPDALRVKYPSAPREWPWQWVFYFATGDYRAVRRIISAFEHMSDFGAAKAYAHTKKTEEDKARALRDGIFQAAAWSLESLLREHEPLKAFCGDLVRSGDMTPNERCALAITLAKVDPTMWQVQFDPETKQPSITWRDR